MWVQEAVASWAAGAAASGERRPCARPPARRDGHCAPAPLGQLGVSGQVGSWPEGLETATVGGHPVTLGRPS